MISDSTTVPKIIVIGNGFDLSLGLESSYNNFIQSKQFHLINRNSNNFFCQHLISQKQLNNWIDIENELPTYSKLARPNFEDEFHSVSAALREYLLQLNYNKIKKDSRAYSLIANSIKYNFWIYDYNYTGSIYRVLTDLGVSEAEISKRVIKVHGSLTDNNIVFGVQDNAEILKKHIFLKKSFNTHFKAIDLNIVLERSMNIEIFGHSLGETDHTYFSNFFSQISSKPISNPKKRIMFYHYGYGGQKQLFTQLDVLTNSNLTRLRQNNEIHLIDSSK